MVRYLTLIGTFICTISMILVGIFGMIPLIMGEIDPTIYYSINTLKNEINIISISLFTARIGIIIIFISTLFKTNIVMILGSIAGILVFVWGGMNEIYHVKPLIFPIAFLSFMSTNIDIVTLIAAILFALGSLLFYKKSKMIVVAGTMLLIYALFYLFLYSIVIDLIFGTAQSVEKRTFNIFFFFFEKVIIAFTGWYISFSTTSISNKRIDLMETTFDFNSSFMK